MASRSVQLLPDRPRATAHEITFAAGAYELLMRSVGAQPPETYAILAGHLDRPFLVTDVRPMPPMTDAQGRMNAGGAHIQINAPFLQYYANVELAPYEKVVLGLCHSHPGGLKTLSRGKPGSGDGDIASIRGTLERAAALVPGWTHFLAPIITFGAHDTPEVTGWIVTLAESEPLAATVRVEAPSRDKPGRLVLNEPAPGEPLLPIAEWISVGNRYQEAINGILGDQTSPLEHRTWMAEFLHRARCDELNACRRSVPLPSVDPHPAG